MQQTALPERRKTTRVPIDLRVNDRTGTVRTVRMASDLSLDGLRLVTTRRYDLGTELDLELRLRDRPEPLQVRGEVVATPEGEVCVRFVGLCTRDRVRLAECMFGEW